MQNNKTNEVCGNCTHFSPVANTDTTGMGICRFSNIWMPVSKDSSCFYQPSTEICCKDCDRFSSDSACMTCDENESAMRDGMLCDGFVDKYAIAVRQAIEVWKARGWDYKRMVDEQIYAVEHAPTPFQPKK